MAPSRISFFCFMLAVAAVTSGEDGTETDFTCPAAKGQFADPHNCSAYYNCWDYGWTKQYCQEGLHFDARMERCNWASAVRCNFSIQSGNESGSSDATPATTSTTVATATVAIFIDPPVNGSGPVVPFAQESFAHHKLASLIIPACRSTNNYPNPCLRPDGTSPDPKNCNAYYDCWKCDYIRRNCTKGLYYDDNSKSCLWQGTTLCSTNTVSVSYPDVPSYGSPPGYGNSGNLPGGVYGDTNGYPSVSTGSPQVTYASAVFPVDTSTNKNNVYPVNKYGSPGDSTGILSPVAPDNGIVPPPAAPGYGQGAAFIPAQTVGGSYGSTSPSYVGTSTPAPTSGAFSTNAPNLYAGQPATATTPTYGSTAIPFQSTSASSYPYGGGGIQNSLNTTSAYGKSVSPPQNIYGGNQQPPVVLPGYGIASNIPQNSHSDLPLPLSSTTVTYAVSNGPSSIPVYSTGPSPAVYGSAAASTVLPYVPASYGNPAPVAPAPGPNITPVQSSPTASTVHVDPSYSVIVVAPNNDLSTPAQNVPGYNAASSSRQTVYPPTSASSVTFSPFNTYATFAPFADYSTIPTLFPAYSSNNDHSTVSTSSSTAAPTIAYAATPAYGGPLPQTSYGNPTAPSNGTIPQNTEINHPDSGTTVYVTNNILTTIVVTNRTNTSTVSPPLQYLQLQNLRQSESFRCPSTAAGVYRDPQDCSSFITCLSGGGWFRTHCPEGSAFDDEKKECGRSWDTARGCRMIKPDSPLASRRESTVTKENQPDPKGLEREVVAHPKTTHPHLFSPQEAATTKISTIPGTQSTVTYQHSDGAVTVQPNPVGVERHSRLSLTPFSMVKKRSLTNELEETPDFICPEKQGLYPHETDCSLFWSCGDGPTVFLQSCPEPLFFNATEQRCEWARGERCVNGKVEVPVRAAHGPAPEVKWTTEPATPKPLNPSSHGEVSFRCPTPEGIFGHPFQCSKYYTCENWVPLLKICDDGKLYNRKSRSCDDAELVVCPQGSAKPRPNKFACPSKDGYFPDPQSCRRFYQCVNFRSYHLLCPGNLLWSTSKLICDWPQEVACGTGFNSNTKFKCPHPNGKYNHPINDGEFYECISSVPQLRHCPQKHTFIANLRICMPNSLFSPQTPSRPPTTRRTTTIPTTASSEEVTDSTPDPVSTYPSDQTSPDAGELSTTTSVTSTATTVTTVSTTDSTSVPLSTTTETRPVISSNTTENPPPTSTTTHTVPQNSSESSVAPNSSTTTVLPATTKTLETAVTTTPIVANITTPSFAENATINSFSASPQSSTPPTEASKNPSNDTFVTTDAVPTSTISTTTTQSAVSKDTSSTTLPPATSPVETTAVPISSTTSASSVTAPETTTFVPLSTAITTVVFVTTAPEMQESTSKDNTVSPSAATTQSTTVATIPAVVANEETSTVLPTTQNQSTDVSSTTEAYNWTLPTDVSTNYSSSTPENSANSTESAATTSAPHSSDTTTVHSSTDVSATVFLKTTTAPEIIGTTVQSTTSSPVNFTEVTNSSVDMANDSAVTGDTTTSASPSTITVSVTELITTEAPLLSSTDTHNDSGKTTSTPTPTLSSATTISPTDLITPNLSSTISVTELSTSIPGNNETTVTGEPKANGNETTDAPSEQNVTMVAATAEPTSNNGTTSVSVTTEKGTEHSSTAQSVTVSSSVAPGLTPIVSIEGSGDGVMERETHLKQSVPKLRIIDASE